MGKFEIIVLLLLVITIFSVMGIAVYYTSSDGGKCTSDPLGYFLEEQNESGINCFCSQESGFPFTFNRTR